MEISAEEIKQMTNSSSAIQMEIKVKEQKLGTVEQIRLRTAYVRENLVSVR